MWGNLKIKLPCHLSIKLYNIDLILNDLSTKISPYFSYLFRFIVKIGILF